MVGRAVRGGGEVVVPAPLERIPVWVRAGSIVVTYPAAHVARGLGDVPEARAAAGGDAVGAAAPGSAAARLADGTRIGWRRGRWWVSPDSGRDVEFREIAGE